MTKREARETRAAGKDNTARRAKITLHFAHSLLHVLKNNKTTLSGLKSRFSVYHRTNEKKTLQQIQ